MTNTQEISTAQTNTEVDEKKSRESRWQDIVRFGSSTAGGSVLGGAIGGPLGAIVGGIGSGVVLGILAAVHHRKSGQH
jgi:hypothetical protein